MYESRNQVITAINNCKTDQELENQLNAITDHLLNNRQDDQLLLEVFRSKEKRLKNGAQE